MREIKGNMEEVRIVPGYAPSLSHCGERGSGTGVYIVLCFCLFVCLCGCFVPAPSLFLVRGRGGGVNYVPLTLSAGEREWYAPSHSLFVVRGSVEM